MELRLSLAHATRNLVYLPIHVSLAQNSEVCNALSISHDTSLQQFLSLQDELINNEIVSNNLRPSDKCT